MPHREFEELRLRLKILESKRAEDRERMKDYERVKNEKDQLTMMQSKLTSTLLICLWNFLLNLF